MPSLKAFSAGKKQQTIHIKRPRFSSSGESYSNTGQAIKETFPNMKSPIANAPRRSAYVFPMLTGLPMRARYPTVPIPKGTNISVLISAMVSFGTTFD